MSSNENSRLPGASMSGDTQRFLAFSLGKEEYAIPLLSVKEVIAIPEVTSIPNAASHFMGIMNLRGTIISIIDLRLKLGVKADRTGETAVIICDLNSMCLGVVVNCVNSVLALREDEIHAKPEVQSSRKTDYIRGVTRKQDKLVLILDIAKALDVADHAVLQQVGKAA